jgi:hypothetical protein
MPLSAGPEPLYQRRREPTLAPPVVDRNIIIRIEGVVAPIVGPSWIPRFRQSKCSTVRQ